jgi:hypothetical protein
MRSRRLSGHATVSLPDDFNKLWMDACTGIVLEG